MTERPSSRRKEYISNVLLHSPTSPKRSSVKWSERDITYHDAAMHPSPSPQTAEAPSPSQENSWKGEDPSNTAAVRTSCTEVCGPSQLSCSRSKICPAKIYPKGARDKAIIAYVILDDQSSCSLAKPVFFELFSVESKPFSCHPRIFSGIVETSGKKAGGFQIKSLDSKLLISLPPLIQCHKILNNRSEIPTLNAVLHQPHLHHIAKHIPELDPEAEIILLLGNDVLRAHKVRQQVNGPHKGPFAQRLQRRC